MRWNRESQVADCTTLLDVLMMLKYKTMLDTNVATLGIVEGIANNNGQVGDWNEKNGYGILNVRPLPTMEKQNSYTIQAYFFDQDTWATYLKPDRKDKSKTLIGKIVLVVFCDRDFIRNLKIVNSGDDQNRVKETKYKELHSLKYGVLVKTL